jgi:hypothetical protein
MGNGEWAIYGHHLYSTFIAVGKNSTSYFLCVTPDLCIEKLHSNPVTQKHPSYFLNTEYTEQQRVTEICRL